METQHMEIKNAEYTVKLQRSHYIEKNRETGGRGEICGVSKRINLSFMV
jgi:hypothetical protein